MVDGKTSETANTSLCPSGWKLPYGNTSGNGATPGGFSYLDIQLGGIGASSDVSTTPVGADMSKIWRAFPNNITLSGYFNEASAVSQGTGGSYWSSTAGDSWDISYSFGIYSRGVNPGTYDVNRRLGYSVRCLVGS